MSKNDYEEVLELLMPYLSQMSPEQIKEYFDEYNENSYEEQWKNLLKETYENAIYFTNSRDRKKSVRTSD